VANAKKCVFVQVPAGFWALSGLSGAKYGENVAENTAQPELFSGQLCKIEWPVPKTVEFNRSLHLPISARLQEKFMTDTAPPPVRNYRLADTVLLQRIENLAILGLAVAAYAWLGQSWLLFAVLFLAPDLFMLGYLHSQRLGALIYNLGHNYAAPIVLALFAPLIGPLAYGLAAIWVAHIGFDRMLGFGLKLGGAFKSTHLNPAR
jgi:hypothetical protein